MEKDTLRRHVYEEIHSQFESKLREAKRQKSQVEEELESASEKWRSERRRLNGEIDRLEAALADAKDIRKKNAGKGGRVSESEEILKIQQANEEKLKKLTHDWEKERSSLQAEVKRLQLGLADVIERSNNPMRSSQAVKDGFEGKLNEALRARRQIEDDFIRAKEEWEQEKIKLAAEMVKLRRESSVKTGKTKSPEDDEPKKPTREALDAKDAAERELRELKGESERLRKQYAAEVAGLQQQLRDAEKAQTSIRREAEQIKEEARALKAGASDQRARFTSHLEEARVEAERVRQALERDLKQAENELEELRRKTSAEIAALRKDTDESSRRAASTTAGSEQLQEVMRHRNFLQQQVHQAEETIRAIRTEQSEEYAQMTAKLEEARGEAARVRKSLERDLQNARAEAETLRQESAAEIDKLREELSKASARTASGADTNKQLQDLLQQKQALQQQVRQAEENVRSIRAEHTKEREELETHRRARATLQAQLEKTKSELDTMRAKLAAGAQQAQPSQKSAQSGDGLNYQLREVMQQRNYLQQQVHQAEEAVRTIRAQHEAEKKQLLAQFEEQRAATQHLEGRLGENNGSVSADVVEQLRKQYDDRMQEVIQQKTKLTEELNHASAMLEAERKRFASAAGNSSKSSGLDHDRIANEVNRVESVIEGISVLIDDPSVELSTVIRKNVERAEWDAYLKGIMFSLGKADGR